MNSELRQANSLYRQSQLPRLSQTLRKSLLKRALAIYQSECKKASPANLISIWRNIGVSSLRLAKFLDPKFNLPMIFYHLSEAVSNLTNAWSSRPGASSEWGSKVEEYIADCFQLSFRSINGDVETQQIPNFHLLDRIEKSIGSAACLDFPIRMNFHLAKGQYFYCCGVKSLEAGNFKVTLQLLEYCHEEAENALRVPNKKDEAIYEIKRFEEDISFLRCICESVRLRTNGDELLTTYNYTNDEEDLNFEIMWDILDMYKGAALKCREKDLKNEAIAISRQARLFDQVFKLRTKAKEYYKLSMNLAQTLFPQDLIDAPWFQETKRMLEKYQKMDLADAEKKKETERAPYLKKMKKELDELERIHRKSNSYKLLKYVYLTHPPKIGTLKYNEKEVNSTNIKKTMMKAITQYHPDKQSKFGMDWKVLSEEITKRLTAQYEGMKGL